LKRSIGKRLFIQIAAVIVVFITIALVSNSVLLKPIYKVVKKNGLVIAMDYINSLDGDYENNLSEILNIEETLAARVLIYKDDEVIYMSAARMLQGRFVNEIIQNGRRGMMPDTAMPSGSVDDVFNLFMPHITEQKEVKQINENTDITFITAVNNAQYMVLDTTLDDGAGMYVVAEMQSLTEAIRIFNLFLLVTAAISTVIILIMTYFMSKRFVSPITNMNDVTKKITKLDFSAKCDVDTKDELQELGESINALSGSLETTIDDLKRELENAKRLEELRKRFVSTVSHDLKTPISLMQGYAIGLKSDLADQKERRDYYAEVIAEESERLGVLVNELMDITQLEAGYIKLNKVDFELSDFIQELVDKFRAANPDITIIYDKPEKEVWCSADVRLTERVAENYLSNALRHVAGKKEIIVGINNKKDYYEVSVKNTGKNIPEESLDEIWNSFYRVDDARSRSDGGHGLGLSIVKNIQIAHEMPYSAKNLKDGVEFCFGVKKGARPK
jgi:signal transduction histidine kinase